mmetsp:Transcript_28950/g.60217  ORF Transcript_28950/g.60217 Transcript_28950/m.60217 type:complete len:158 (+) Transcript_28950:596-1069(+)
MRLGVRHGTAHQGPRLRELPHGQPRQRPRHQTVGGLRGNSSGHPCGGRAGDSMGNQGLLEQHGCGWVSCLPLRSIDLSRLPGDGRPRARRHPQRTWQQLSEAERTTAKQLGVRAATHWDHLEAPVWGITWGSLSGEQKMAARKLGWTEHTWATHFDT